MYDPKAWKISAITIAIVAAFSVGLVLYGVYSHKEAGLMTACKVGVHYDYSGDCFPVRMPSPPVVVDAVIPDRPAMNHVRNLRRAIDDINRDVGLKILVEGDLVDSVCDGDLCYYPEQAYSTSWRDSNGSASHYEYGTAAVLRCDVVTRNTVLAAAEQLVIEHEILHCLGLDHDSYEQSIMYSEYTLGTNPVISDFDKKLLRNTYAE